MTNVLSTIITFTFIFYSCLAMTFDLDHHITCQPGVQFYNRVKGTCVPCRTTCPKNQYIVQLCSAETDSKCGSIKFDLFQIISRTSTLKVRTPEPTKPTPPPPEVAMLREETLYHVGAALVVILALIGLLAIVVAYMSRSYRICGAEKKEIVFENADEDLSSEKDLFIESDTLFLITETDFPQK